MVRGVIHYTEYSSDRQRHTKWDLCIIIDDLVHVILTSPPAQRSLFQYYVGAGSDAAGAVVVVAGNFNFVYSLCLMLMRIARVYR